MTLLTHDVQPPCLVRQDRNIDRSQMGANASRETAMRVFFRAAVTLMLATAALAGIIALKTAIYLPHFNS